MKKLKLSISIIISSIYLLANSSYVLANVSWCSPNIPLGSRKLRKDIEIYKVQKDFRHKYMKMLGNRDHIPIDKTLSRKITGRQDLKFPKNYRSFVSRFSYLGSISNSDMELKYIYILFDEDNRGNLNIYSSTMGSSETYHNMPVVLLMNFDPKSISISCYSTK